MSKLNSYSSRSHFFFKLPIQHTKQLIRFSPVAKTTRLKLHIMQFVNFLVTDRLSPFLLQADGLFSCGRSMVSVLTSNRLSPFLWPICCLLSCGRSVVSFFVACRLSPVLQQVGFLLSCDGWMTQVVCFRPPIILTTIKMAYVI